MRVLVVEDSEDLQVALRKGLTAAGHVVDIVGDGKQGWIYASSNDYDVVVLDLTLPELDGMAVLRRLREEGHETHVLILTARGALDDRVEGLRSGADDYLSKPFHFAELLARIEALGRRRYRMKNPTLQLGSLEIDTAMQAVKWQGVPVELTRREYSLLVFLARRQGEVVSRMTIEDHLYNELTLPHSNALDVAVCNLRAKLASVGCEDLVRTRRGSGYVIEQPTT